MPDSAEPHEAGDRDRIAVAEAYVDALRTHDSRQVVFHPAAVRYEAGLKTGFSGAHLHRSLDRGKQYRVIRDIYRVEWTVVDSRRVLADYLLDAGLFGRRLITVRIVETFTIPVGDPRIHRIDAHLRRPGPARRQ